jgi:hypothetical protein
MPPMGGIFIYLRANEGTSIQGDILKGTASFVPQVAEK